MQDKPTILIDSNAVCHKVKHTLGDLTNESMNVGIIFGYLMQTLWFAKTFETDRLVHIWDSSKSLRVKFFPTYKEKRRTTKSEKTPEEKEIDNAAYRQFDLLYEEIIPKIGFKNNFKVEGYEGDDLIASIIDNNDDTFVMTTGDEDMYQCLCPGVTMMKKVGKKIIRYSEKEFFEEYGISPTKWAEVKALAGCDSDEIPGISGVGEKTAIKYITGNLKPTTKAFRDIISSEGKRITKRNRQLVTLPYPGCPDIKLDWNETLSLDNFMEICNKYHFPHFLKKEELTKWKTLLNLR